MGEIDFEAEARARRELVDLLRVVSGRWYRDGEMSKMLRDAADRIENDARARAEGKADGYRRGLEVAKEVLNGCALMGGTPIGPLYGAGWSKCLETARERLDALLAPEPAKAER